MTIFLFYQDMHNYNTAKSANLEDKNAQFIAILFFVITIIAILVCFTVADIVVLMLLI
jgi:hypothetical protein